MAYSKKLVDQSPELILLQYISLDHLEIQLSGFIHEVIVVPIIFLHILNHLLRLSEAPSRKTHEIRCQCIHGPIFHILVKGGLYLFQI